MKKTFILMSSFIILFIIIFYEAQVSIKVGQVYEVPFATNESLLSNLNIDIDEERIKSKAIEILSYLFEDKFNVEDYEVSVDFISEAYGDPYYSLYFYNTKTQREGYSIDLDTESGDIVFLWNNELQDIESIASKEQMDEKKLQEVAESYFKKIHMDEAKEFQLTQKIYILPGIQFIYKDSKHSEKASILLRPETAEFIYYIKEPDL